MYMKGHLWEKADDRWSRQTLFLFPSHPQVSSTPRCLSDDSSTRRKMMWAEWTHGVAGASPRLSPSRTCPCPPENHLADNCGTKCRENGETKPRGDPGDRTYCLGKSPSESSSSFLRGTCTALPSLPWPPGHSVESAHPHAHHLWQCLIIQAQFTSDLSVMSLKSVFEVVESSFGRPGFGEFGQPSTLWVVDYLVTDAILSSHLAVLLTNNSSKGKAGDKLVPLPHFLETMWKIYPGN